MARSRISQVQVVLSEREQRVQRRRTGDANTVHYVDADKKLDGGTLIAGKNLNPPEDNAQLHRRSISPASLSGVLDPPENSEETAVMTTEKGYDTQQHHKPITAERNFDKVNFGRWQMTTWYFSPYPLAESESDDLAERASLAAQNPRLAGVTRPTVRSHGRTSDLMTSGPGRTQSSGPRPILWVCDRCFKYMADGPSWELHIKKCARTHPPGRKVYQRGAHIIWEVDAAKEKLYCQNLSLFGKLFIDVKTLFFDCDNFLFYILTDADPHRDHVLGFFSKEKVSYDDYNLACIISLPPYQKMGYGMLLIEFSYELSRRSGKIGTPERPLSALGLRSYLTYWISTLVRFLRRLLSVMPAELAQKTSAAKMPHVRSPSGESEDGTIKPKKKKKSLGDDAADPRLAVAPLGLMDDTLFKSLRTIEMICNPDGSATSHVVARCTLGDLARATNLRPEDAAFALDECGLLSRKKGDGDEAVIAVSREMVEAVAKERRVKRMCMDLAHVLL